MMTTITSSSLSLPLTDVININGSESVTNDIGRIATASSTTAAVTGGQPIHANTGDCLTSGMSTRYALLAPVCHHSPSSAISLREDGKCWRYRVQHVWVLRHSTVSRHTLLESVNYWTLALNNSKGVAMAYSDYAKAFDVVIHSKILLSACGISLLEI